MPAPLVTMVRNLQQRKGRRRRALTLAEGMRVVEEALAADVRVTGVIVAPSFGDTPRSSALLAALAARAIPIEELAERPFAHLAGTETPQGIIAVIEPRRWTLTDLVVGPGAPVLVLDGVQDPGNVGTLLRTAFALGAAGVVLLRGTADLANPKVVRGAMGATFRLPAVPLDEAEFAAWATRERLTVWVAAAEGAPLPRLAAPERLALVVGNEGAGVSPALRSLAQHQVAIPLVRGAESLNVAAAAAILLYEARRAR